MSDQLIPLTRFPVRPTKIRGESLAGYVRRCYWENGYEVPVVLRAALSDLYQGHDPYRAFKRIEEVFPSGSVSQIWWLTHRLDAFSAAGYRPAWLHFHYTSIRYCPFCLNGDEFHREQWMLPLVTACARHQCELVSRCHACGQNSAWGAIKPGWYCSCGSPLRDAPTRRATPWSVRFSTLVESAMDYSEELEQVGALDELYGFITWAYALRRQLGRRHPFASGKRHFIRPTAWTHSEPDTWEESLLMVKGGLGNRKLQALVKWDFRGRKNMLDWLRPERPLALALEALANLPRNRYSSELHLQAGSLLGQLHAGIDGCPGIYVHPRFVGADRQPRLVALARWWNTLANRMMVLDPEFQLGRGGYSSSDFARSELVAQILNTLLDAALGDKSIDFYSKLTLRWHVPEKLRTPLNPNEILNALGSYFGALRYAELAFVADLLSDGQELATWP